jgi:hypothetical protein
MESIRASIDGAVKEVTDTWAGAVGAVRAQRDSAQSRFNGAKHFTVSHITQAEEAVTGAKHNVEGAAKEIQGNAQRVREELKPTIEFFHLHPVVSSLSVGAAVQAMRVGEWACQHCLYSIICREKDSIYFSWLMLCCVLLSYFMFCFVVLYYIVLCVLCFYVLMFWC